MRFATARLKPGPFKEVLQEFICERRSDNSPIAGYWQLATGNWQLTYAGIQPNRTGNPAAAPESPRKGASGPQPRSYRSRLRCGRHLRSLLPDVDLPPRLPQLLPRLP